MKDQQDSERVFSRRIELPLELKTATDSLILTLNPPTNVFMYFEYNKNKEISLSFFNFLGWPNKSAKHIATYCPLPSLI